MRRRGVLISVWALTTVAATFIAWAAVRQVTNQVSPQAVLPLPQADVIADVAPSQPPSTDAEVAQENREPGDRVGGNRAGETGGGNNAGAADPPRDPDGAGDDAGAADADDPPAHPANPPRRDEEPDRAEEEPQQEEEAEPPAPATFTEAYDLVGGVVTIRYRGASATLLEASPESGFVAEVNDGGPDKVDVRFRSDDHESRIVARVHEGQPDPEIEERSR